MFKGWGRTGNATQDKIKGLTMQVGQLKGSVVYWQSETLWIGRVGTATLLSHVHLISVSHVRRLSAASPRTRPQPRTAASTARSRRSSAPWWTPTARPPPCRRPSASGWSSGARRGRRGGRRGRGRRPGRRGARRRRRRRGWRRTGRRRRGRLLLCVVCFGAGGGGVLFCVVSFSCCWVERGEEESERPSLRLPDALQCQSNPVSLSLLTS